MKELRFVICIDNSEYPAALEKRKIYEVLPDSGAENINYIRIIAESGEDYLYPASCFVDANLSKETREAVAKAA